MSRRKGAGDILARFGSRVRTFREELQLTQEQFADHIGLDRTYVSGIERGVRNVSLRNIARIADGLGVPIIDLFVDEGKRRLYGTHPPGREYRSCRTQRGDRWAAEKRNLACLLIANYEYDIVPYSQLPSTPRSWGAA